MTTHSYATLSDQDLVAETKRLATAERLATAALVRSLVELDARRLYLAEGCATLFKYCTEVFDRALTLLLKDARRQRYAYTDAPRPSRELLPGSRKVPAAVQRAVWTRDESRCTFVGPNGRCAETSFLQFHHDDPFAMGGPPTVENIHLRCAAHNRYEAELFFAVNYPGIVREVFPEWPS